MFTYSFLKEASARFRGWIDELLSSAWKACQETDVLIADPAEEDFPFRGRTLFQEPGGRREALIGRAEAAREIYAERLETQRREIRALGASLGFPALLHRTDHSAAPALAMLAALVSEHVG